MPNPETILIKRIKKDDKEAFRDIYNLYKVRVFSFASRYLSNETDIEEIIQEVFTKLWITRKRIKEEYPLHNYLFTITKNTILHKKQKQVNEQKYLEYLRVFYTISSLSTQKKVEFNEVSEKVDQAIDSLPEKRRQIFLLNRNDGLTYKEIAEKLELSIKTVEAHMRLALQDLRRELKGYL